MSLLSSKNETADQEVLLRDSTDDSENEFLNEKLQYAQVLHYKSRKLDIIRLVSVFCNIVLIGIVVFLASKRVGLTNSSNKYAIAPSMNQHYEVFEYSDLASYQFKYFSKTHEQRVVDNWDELLSTVNFLYTPEEVEHSGRLNTGKDIEQAVILPNGTYFGSIYAYHHLHCIKNIFYSLFKEEYGEEISSKSSETYKKDHLVHCLDWLRQAVMCNPDMTPLYFVWSDIQKKPAFEARENHQCTNWEDVTSWSKERMFDPFSPGLLSHPKYGNPYVDDLSE